MQLINLLVEKLGITEEQALGGTGVVLKLAKENMAPEDFNKISKIIPEIESIIDSAPEGGIVSTGIGMIGSMLGGDKSNNIGNLAKTFEGFSKLGIDSEKASQFIPIVLSFIDEKSEDSSTKDILEGILK